MTEHGPSEWFEDAARIVNGVTERWALAGALAALRYRRVERGTTDVDFLVGWDDRLAPAMTGEGYTVSEKIDPLVGHPHLLICDRGPERIDLMIATVPYQDLAIERAVDHVLTVEDVIVHKLLAWRPRDQEDIASILAAGHDLDHAYLDHWVDEWAVRERWDEARRAR